MHVHRMVLTVVYLHCCSSVLKFVPLLQSLVKTCLVYHYRAYNDCSLNESKIKLVSVADSMQVRRQTLDYQFLTGHLRIIVHVIISPSKV